MLLKVSQTFRALQPGEILEVLSSDADTPENLLKVLPAPFYEVVSIEKLGKINPYYRIRLQKKEQSKISQTFGSPLGARNNF
jgi:TusA-related sulfurtransferase